MKAAYISSLAPDTTIATFFLVWEKETRTAQNGKPYIQLKLGDRTGTLDAKIWDAQSAPAFERNDFIYVKANVQLYRDKKQMIVQQLRRAEANEVDMSDYLPRTTEDVEALFATLQAEVEAVKNPWLKKLLQSVVTDPAIAPRIKQAPAAMKMHHAFLGGLLEHVVSLCGLCRAIAGRYPEVNVDLLVSAAVLHDVGKISELTYDRAFGYSSEGQLLGHILIEYEMVAKKIDAIEGFPPPLKTVMMHMLVSHHGEYEFGSPKLPMFREALLFHYLDDMDSKMASMRASLAAPEGEPGWTSRNPALGRTLLRLDEFLKGLPKGEATAAGVESKAAKNK
ncbi:MAG: HD domain-containing protein [Acidobacteria bacterium]|nr:HD domain-containing protein [Acidobacteriota bacterium]